MGSLHYAAYNGDAKIVKALINNNTDINVVTTKVTQITN